MPWNESEALDAAGFFQRGDERGFTYFFEELHSQLLFFAFKITNDKDSAEDVVEESFIKAWQNRETLSHHKVIKSWLYTTVKNGALNFLAKTAYKNKVEAGAAELLDTIDESVDHKMIKSEVYGELYGYMDMLPKECKKIFYLLYREGKSAREVAEISSLNISTIKNQKARGISLIINWLSGNGEKRMNKTGAKTSSNVKSQIQLLRENNVGAWNKLYEDNQEEFHDSFKGQFGVVTRENIIFESIEMVRRQKYNLPCAWDYKHCVKHAIRQKIKQLKNGITGALLQPIELNKPIGVIKPKSTFFSFRPKSKQWE